MLGIAEAKLAEWERTLEDASPSEIRDLAVTLNIPVGVPPEDDESSIVDSPFAALTYLATPYGTLRICFASQAAGFPIDERNRERVLNQIQELDVQEEAKFSPWLPIQTMDNITECDSSISQMLR